MQRADEPALPEPRARSGLLPALFFVSGASGLGYQMVWTRGFGAGLGHEVPALLGVVSAFLGGMALGGWYCQGRLRRSARPLGWYAGLELVLGLWGAATAWLIPFATTRAQLVLGSEPSAAVRWVMAFALPLGVLLPATAAMGATLPAMERAVVAERGDGRWVGGLYAANTAGACIGTFLAVYFWMPWLGLRSTALALGGASVACGAVAWWLARTVPAARRPQAKPSAAIEERSEVEPLPTARWRLTAFATGVLGLGFQVVTVRMLSQVLENTLYTYAAVLGTYLAATAAGAAVYQRWGRRLRLDTLLYLLASACVLSAWIALGLPALYRAARAALGDSLPDVLGAEMAAAFSLLGLPAALMGATFSHIAQRAAREQWVGLACALNTVGSAVAVGLFGIGLLPHFGLKGTMLLVTAGYLLCLPSIRKWTWTMALLLPFGSVVCLPPLHLAELPPGAERTAFREGALATVMVVRTPDGQRSLRVNGRLQMGGTAAATAERRQAHLPLLFQGHPGRALFLGPGTGITLGAAAQYPGVQLEAVELVSEIIDVLGEFEPENGGVRTNAAVRWVVSDARRYVRTSRQQYDVIVADLFHPAQDGAGFLYTREHFEAIRQRLATGGLFCQWLPLHQLNEETTRSIVRTFLGVFPQAEAVLLHFNVDIPVLGLLGREDGARVAWKELEQRMSEGGLPEALRGVGLERPIQLLGCLVADADGLRRYAGDAPLCTDDAPFVLFAAPRYAARREQQPSKTLLSFLQQVGEPSARLVSEHIPDNGSAGGSEAIRRNVKDFIGARNIYLRGLAEEGAGELGTAIERYLESAQRSLFFTPAYARMVTIIQLLATSERGRARDLFQRLEKARPDQPLGRRLLGQMLEE